MQFQALVHHYLLGLTPLCGRAKRQHPGEIPYMTLRDTVYDMERCHLWPSLWGGEGGKSLGSPLLTEWLEALLWLCVICSQSLWATIGVTLWPRADRVRVKTRGLGWHAGNRLVMTAGRASLVMALQHYAAVKHYNTLDRRGGIKRWPLNLLVSLNMKRSSTSHVTTSGLNFLALRS